MIMTESVGPTALLSYLYFLQGLPYGLQARFLPIYFRAHGMSLTNISYIKALFFPWMCKTLWAPLVDRHGNKKMWLQWSMVGLCLTCVVAAGIEPSWMLALCTVLLIFNLLTSTQDIATDGLAIEILTSSQVANGNIAQVVGYKFGAIIGGGLLAWLSDRISWSTIFLLLTALYLSAVSVVRKYVPGESHSKFDVTLEVAQPQNSKTPTSEFQSDENDCKSPDFAPSCAYSKCAPATSNTPAPDCSGNQIPNSSAKLGDGDQHTAWHGDHMCSKERCEAYERSSERRESGGLGWVVGHFAQVLAAEGTVWILLYVLLYKLGEQGALNMMPMFLMDHGVAASDVGLWTGVVGQAVSIAGSVVGGLAISSNRFSSLRLLWVLSVGKVLVLACEWWAVSAWSLHSNTQAFGTVPCVTLMLTLLAISGAISTAAFTLMMQCSQRANPRCRSSHYSLLATAEVVGKLTFSVFVGALTDAVGYSVAFGLFVTLSAGVLPLFWYSPGVLTGQSAAHKHC